ncbi:unnamed protein product [Oikopleura dioica]|uniref:Uncharacterized protein n=1 Tax=Oikopleura dioica TaxID=34765 RepID=E4XII1_OIKDI|nr:unnamed protein product [Oikopleura dioica]
MVVLFEKQIEKLFMNGRLFEQNCEYVEKFVMKRRHQIWNEIKKLADSIECRGGKWINICKSISSCSSNSFDNRNDGFRISDRSNSDSSGDSDYDNRERRRNLRELQADEMNHEIERVDDIWERMIRAEAELPYGYFDAIAATTEFTNVEELEFENLLIFHSENDFVMDGKNMKPVKKALKNLSTAIGESKLFNHIYLYKPDIIKFLEQSQIWHKLRNHGISSFIWAVNLSPDPKKEKIGELLNIWKLEKPLDKDASIDWMDEEDWEEYVLKCECVP